MPERSTDRPPDGSPKDVARALMLAVLAGIGAVVGLLVAYEALVVLKVVAVAVLLALVLRTLARGLEKLGASPFVAALILLAGVGALAALVYYAVLPNVAQEVEALASDGGPTSLDAVASSLRDLPFAPDLDEVLEQLEGYLQGLIGSLPQILFGAAEAATYAVTAVFLALYFAVSPDTYVRGMLRLVPVARREGARKFVDVLSERLRGWVVGTGMVASFVGVSAGVGLWLLDVPLALTFGLLAGFLDLIPLFGSIVGGALPALLALTISPEKALAVVALFVFINQIEGNLLQPRLMGRRVHVPSALVLVSILLLATLVGPIIGTLLAIPTAVVAVTLVDQLTADEPPREKEEPADEDAGKQDE